jgi:hypothetical protein
MGRAFQANYDLLDATTLREKIHNPFNWKCDCDPTCWCVTSRLGRALMWYVPSRFHHRPPRVET